MNNVQRNKIVQQMQQMRKVQIMQQIQTDIKEYTKNLLTPLHTKDKNVGVVQNYIERENIVKADIAIDNTPYKQIIRDGDHAEDYKKKHKKETFNDEICLVKEKNTEGVDEAYKDKVKNIKKQNKVNKKIFSNEKMEEHKKKFEYRKSGVAGIKYNPADHGELKKDRIKFYEKAQKELEKNNTKVENILEQLKDNGILNDDQINSTLIAFDP